MAYVSGLSRKDAFIPERPVVRNGLFSVLHGAHHCLLNGNTDLLCFRRFIIRSFLKPVGGAFVIFFPQKVERFPRQCNDVKVLLSLYTGTLWLLYVMWNVFILLYPQLLCLCKSPEAKK